MQRLVTAALKQGTVSSYTGSTAFPTGWTVAGGLGAALLGILILSAWRRRAMLGHVADRVGHFRYRPSS